jgi:adenylate kinase family enzyme
MVVIHIAGPPSSGKTTLARTLISRFPTLLVLDLDDVNREFVEKHKLLQLLRTRPVEFQALYQKHIDKLVRSAHRSNQPLVFVGIEGVVLGTQPGKDFLTVDLNADVRLCLNIPTAENVRRWIQRDFVDAVDGYATSLKQDVTHHFNQYKNNETEFVKKRETNFHALMRDFRPSQRTRDIERFKTHYKSLGFRFVSSETAVEIVSQLI